MRLTRRKLLSTLMAFAGFGLVSNRASANPRLQANRSRPSASQKSNLRAARLISQSERRGGHFNNRHVGKPLSYLQARDKAPSMRAGFAAAARGARVPNPATTARVARAMTTAPKQSRRKEFSTFSNQEVAQAALSRALTRNDAQIRAWLKSGKPRLAIQTKVPGSSGIVFLPASGRVVQPKKAIFVLRRDGRAFRLHTGFVSSAGGPRQ